MYLKKQKNKLLAAVAVLLLSTPVFSQENFAIAYESKPTINFPHNMYVVTTAGKLTVIWTGSSPPWALQACYPLLNNKCYEITEDLDGDPNNREWQFQLPRTGHAFIQLKHANNDEWVDGKDTKIQDEPIGWYLFVQPAPVTGGGISSTPESFRDDLN